MEGPVVLCFGVVRPYKGVDVLLEAFREVDGAELWVVGRPLGESMERLRRLAPPGRVRFVPRYVSDRELPAFFRRADLLVLPHRRVDVSGVLFAGLAFGKAMVLSDVGGFREVAAGARRRAARPAGGPRGAGRRHPRAARPTRRARASWPARAGGRRGPLLVGPHRRADARPLRGAGRREGRVHGQEQALGGAGARLARGAAAARCRPWWPPSRTSGRSTSSGWTWWPRRTGSRCWARSELYAAAASAATLGRRGPRGVVPLLEPHPRAADLARPDRLRQPPPRAACPTSAEWAATTSRSSRAATSGACPATSWTTGIDTGDLVEVERFPIDPAAETALSLDVLSQERLLGALPARDRAARWPARSCRASPRARAATCRARSSRSCAWCGRATTSSASCAPSGTRPGRGGDRAWTGRG